MSLTRFLPVPSDRMGILWSLLAIDGCVVLEYGPAGTTHFSVGLFGELGVDRQNRLFTTHMREDDVVMGDVSRLEKAIVEIDRNLSPKAIFVVASSVAAVIGADIRGVCSYMQERVSARLIAFEQGGFRGDYAVGLMEAYKLLAEQLPADGPAPQPDTVNLIGFSMGSYRALSDRWELEDLLRRAFGLRVGACLCGETGMEEIERMGGAALNLVLREEGLPAARMLRARFGTPMVTGAPYGYAGTLEWLQKIADALGREIDPVLRAEIAERMSDASQYRMSLMMLRKDRPAVTVAGEYRAIVGVSGFLEGLGLPVVHKLCLHSLRAVAEPDPTVRLCRSEGERLEILKGLHRQLILADDPSLSVCPPDNVTLRFAMPVTRGAQVARHLPLMGLRGADYIAESVEEYLQMLR